MSALASSLPAKVRESRDFTLADRLVVVMGQYVAIECSRAVTVSHEPKCETPPPQSGSEHYTKTGSEEVTNWF